MAAKCRRQRGNAEDDGAAAKATTIFTIGFAKKSAREFFALLEGAGVRRVVDVRLNNVSQLAGFTKRHDLEFFLDRICGTGYVHAPGLAPTKEILNDYKAKAITWADYEHRFASLMADRCIENMMTRREMDRACLLCSEPTADRCHRRLVAEYLRDKWEGTRIVHL